MICYGKGRQERMPEEKMTASFLAVAVLVAGEDAIESASTHDRSTSWKNDFH